MGIYPSDGIAGLPPLTNLARIDRDNPEQYDGQLVRMSHHKPAYGLVRTELA